MNNESVSQAILIKLDLVYQKISQGDLASAYQIIEEVGSLIIDSNTEEDEKNGIEKEFFLELIHLHASLRRKLLKEMAKRL